MLARGELPHFQRLQAQGSYHRLGTSNPPQSPVAWCTFATGRNPGQHGVYDFLRRRPDSYLPDLSLTRLEGDRSRPVRRTSAFWQYGAELHVPMCILACPVTFPPDELYGRMLAGMGTPDLLGTQGTFAFYTTRKETVSRDTGGEVHVVPPGDRFDLAVYGPQKKGRTGQLERLTVPFQVRVNADRTAATVTLAEQEFTLTPGQWSGWQSVSFKVGPLRHMDGILQMQLTELKPDFGLYVSPIGIDPRRPWFPVSEPKDYSRRLVEELGLFSTRGMPFDTWALNEGRISEEAFMAHARELLQERIQLLDLELKRFRQGVLFCYFEYPDMIQHMYWRTLDPGSPVHDPKAPPAQQGMIADCYRQMDRVVGLALNSAETNDVVIVLSDHGCTNFRRVAHINSWLREQGFLVIQDSKIGEGGAPLFRNVDWSRTRAYALGFGGIYLNRKGREPQGTVPTGDVADALKHEIADRLKGWIDPANGTAVVRRVFFQEDIFKGPEAVNAPDLWAGMEAGYGASWQTALGAAPVGALVENNLKKWSGTHLVDPELVPGVLFCNRPIRLADPTLYDLAPTILTACGMADARLKAEGMEGRPLF
jgi:predicted AlkP superfamily phosphohydrolase/phosphomutase